jgi:hypothetical protein
MSTAALFLNLFINEGRNAAKSTPDNSMHRSLLEVRGIPNVEQKLQCNLCGKGYKGINERKYYCVTKFQ